MLSKMEIAIGLRPNFIIQILKNKQKELNGESFSNFSKLFLSPFSTICTIIYFIWQSDYSGLKFLL